MTEASEPLPVAFLGDSRRNRMLLLILEHPEFDWGATRGKLIFDMGCGQNGQPEVAWQFIPRPERLT